MAKLLNRDPQKHTTDNGAVRFGLCAIAFGILLRAPCERGFPLEPDFHRTSGEANDKGHRGITLSLGLCGPCAACGPITERSPSARIRQRRRHDVSAAPRQGMCCLDQGRCCACVLLAWRSGAVTLVTPAARI